MGKIQEEKNKGDKKKQPEEIIIDDDDDDVENVNDKAENAKYHKAFENFLSKSKNQESESMGEDTLLENKRETRHNSRLRTRNKEKVVKPSIIPVDLVDDDIVIYDPLEEGRKAKESKEKQLENIELNDVKLSDEDSSNDEDKEEKNKVKQDRKSKITEKDIGHSKGKKMYHQF